MTMTFAAVPALRTTPDARRRVGAAADGAAPTTATLRPAAEKGSAKCGMAMTEKQGGSRRAHEHDDRHAASPRASTSCAGHKWFCSAPMCDLFLVLAQTDEGVSCFAVPRILPDGTRNPFRLQRLKDKLGNRSNASSEVEFDGTWGRLVGEPGRGVPTIIEMVGHTRLDCVVGSAAGMRWAVANATWHAAHRSAFGKLLADQPLMAQRPGRPGDRERGGDRAGHAPRARLRRGRRAAASASGPRSAKYYVCKRFPGLAFEALECLGGNGYVEESGMPRHLPRGAAELDLGGLGQRQRARRPARDWPSTPEVLHGFFDELARGRRRRRAPGRVRSAALRDELADLDGIEVRARRLVERMALCWQGSLLVRHAPAAVADAFCAARLGGDAGLAYGTLPRGRRHPRDRRAPHPAGMSARRRRAPAALLTAAAILARRGARRARARRPDAGADRPAHRRRAAADRADRRRSAPPSWCRRCGPTTTRAPTSATWRRSGGMARPS